MIPLILVVVVLVFLILHMVPGDPVITILGMRADEERVAEMRRHLGLDKPFWAQFWDFIKGLARGDLGESIVVRIPVMDMVKQRLPVTLFIVAYAMAMALIMTIPLSVLSALKRGSLVDQLVRWFSVVMIATPGFWRGILLMILLGVEIPLFPIGGAGKTFVERLHHLFLPSFTSALYLTAVLTRNLRDAVITALGSEHVVFARGKGLRESIVLMKHVFRNAMVSGVTLFGLYIGWMVGGSVIMESVFAIPGMGRGLVGAILARDYPVVQGFTLVYAVMVMSVYLITDIVYSFVDPRIEL